jgi:hypothetical protein
MTGMTPRFLRAEPGAPHSAIDTAALWWPPAKIVGRHLAPFLATTLGLSHEAPPASQEALRVEVECEKDRRSAWTPI